VGRFWSGWLERKQNERFRLDRSSHACECVDVWNGLI
jgi:hypothetical protein